MTFDIKKAVDVTFTVQKMSRMGDSFGIPLFIDDIATIGDRVLSFTSYEEAETYLSADAKIAVKSLLMQTSRKGKKVGLFRVGYRKTSATAETLAEAYAEIKKITKEFYAVIPVKLIDTGDVTQTKELADMIEMENRILAVATKEADTKAEDSGSSTFAKKAFASALNNTFTVYSSDAEAHAGAVMMGKGLPDNIATTNICYAPLAGIKGEELTTTERGHVINKYCNRIESDGIDTIMPAVSDVDSQGGMYGGIMASGQFIDLIVAKHYLEEKITVGIYELIKYHPDKIPFTPSGSAIIESRLSELLTEYGLDTGIISSFTINMPDLATYSTTKKGQRWFDGIGGDGELAGAINKVSINYRLNI